MSCAHTEACYVISNTCCYFLTVISSFSRPNTGIESLPIARSLTWLSEATMALIVKPTFSGHVSRTQHHLAFRRLVFLFFFSFFDQSALERLRRTIGACVISTFLRSVPIHTMIYYQTFVNRYSASNLQSILVLIVTSSGSKNRSANAGSESDTGRRMSIAFSWAFIAALGS